MLLPELRKAVFDANLELVRQGLVRYTFGNASGISQADGLVVIKPSGVAYDTMQIEDMVVTDLNGKVVDGWLKPSVDLPTHLELYKAFPGIGGVVHTHSEYATAWAQAKKEIPCFGTTHADYFYGSIPLTPPLTEAQVNGPYETNTGLVIARRFETLDPMSTPGVLVSEHAPFAWGKTPAEAAYHAGIIEYAARLAFLTIGINPHAAPASDALIERHYLRKHGPKATYGQQ